MDDLKKIIGTNLRRLRTQKGISKQFIARIVDVNVHTIKAIEDGDVELTASQLFKLSVLFKISVDEFCKSVKAEFAEAHSMSKQFDQVRVTAIANKLVAIDNDEVIDKIDKIITLMAQAPAAEHQNKLTH